MKRVLIAMLLVRQLCAGKDSKVLGVRFCAGKGQR